jgi:hypothetical protein
MATMLSTSGVLRTKYMPPQTFHTLVALRGRVLEVRDQIDKLIADFAGVVAMVPTHRCAGCGANFMASHPRQRYHTEACRRKARNRRRKEVYYERTHPEEAEA